MLVHPSWDCWRLSFKINPETFEEIRSTPLISNCWLSSGSFKQPWSGSFLIPSDRPANDNCIYDTLHFNFSPDSGIKCVVIKQKVVRLVNYSFMHAEKTNKKQDPFKGSQTKKTKQRNKTKQQQIKVRKTLLSLTIQHKYDGKSHKATRRYSKKRQVK